MQIIKTTSGKPWLFIVSLCFALYGCIADPKMVDLDDTLRAYDRAVRWSSYQMIPSFRKKEKASSEVLAYDRLKSVRVTGYSRKQFRVSDTGTEVDQVVEIRYYDENVAREKVEIDTQKWTYDSDLDRWVLVSDLPKFIYP
jgi:hypothetical protein